LGCEKPLPLFSSLPLYEGDTVPPPSPRRPIDRREFFFFFFSRLVFSLFSFFEGRKAGFLSHRTRNNFPLSFSRLGNYLRLPPSFIFPRQMEVLFCRVSGGSVFLFRLPEWSTPFLTGPLFSCSVKRFLFPFPPFIGSESHSLPLRRRSLVRKRNFFFSLAESPFPFPGGFSPTLFIFFRSND